MTVLYHQLRNDGIYVKNIERMGLTSDTVELIARNIQKLQVAQMIHRRQGRQSVPSRKERSDPCWDASQVRNRIIVTIRQRRLPQLDFTALTP